MEDINPKNLYFVLLLGNVSIVIRMKIASLLLKGA